MIKQHWLKISLLILMLLSLIPVGACWVINDEAATRGVLQQVFALLKDKISVEKINSPLRHGIELHQVKFHTDSQSIQIKDLKLVWQLEWLSSGWLKINQLKLDGVKVELRESAEKSDFDPLAKIDLPLQIALEDFSLTDLHIKQQKNSYQIDKIQFSAVTTENQLQLSALKIQGQGTSANVTAHSRLGEGFAFGINIDWQFTHAELGQWRGVLTATGDSSTINFDNQLLLPFIFKQQGRVENVMKNPTLATNGHWQNLRWPLTGKILQISSPAGDFKATGSAQAFQVQLNAQLKQAQLNNAKLHFTGDGNQQSLHIAQLNLLTPSGNLAVQGDVSWDKITKFDLSASGLHFNPAIAMPDMAGNLNFKTQLKGQLLAEKLQLAVDINYLTGKLRNYPVAAQGQLNLLDQQLTIKNINLASGENKLLAKGSLGEKTAALDILITAPQLHSLWPTLGGQLNATAHLQGELNHPSLQLKASGKQLRFAEHAVKQLAVAVDYAADGKKNSQLQMTAAGLSSGKNSIEKLQLTGQGTLKQHSFNAQVNSPQGDMSLALTGAWQDNHWQGHLSKLLIYQALAGSWQLKAPITLAVAKHNAGMDVLMQEGCFFQNAAFVCLQGSYPANGNFQAEVRALLPTTLGKKYFPAEMQLESEFNLKAKVAKNSAGMFGQYQLSLSKNSKLAFTVDKQLTQMTVNTLAVAGTLQGTRVNSKLDVMYADKNYLRGQLEFDTANKQTMSGQLSAAIMDFSPLMPFIVPLSELKGNLTAAVTLAGTLAKPELTGNVSLNNTSVTAENAGIHLQGINLKLHTQAANPKEIVIAGKVKSGTGSLNLTGTAQAEPALGYPVKIQLSGSEFEVVKLPQAHISISPELICRYGKEGGAVSGKLTLAEAKIELAELPANAAVPSEDEEVVGEAVKKADNKDPALPFAVDIALDLGKSASFSGLGMKTQLAGNLKLSKQAELLAMYGEVQMQKARYKSYGQDLTVRRGKFIFNGSPSNPILDVEAIRLSKSKKITAVLKVTGALHASQTQIFSEPVLPESDALAYLITGNSLSQLTKSDSNLLASAALSYGSGKMAWLTEKFGLDEMELEEGETMKDSLLAIGQYLTPDFYVGAKVGLFNKQTSVITKYKIMDSLSIGTQSGDSQRVNLNYEFSHE